MRFVKIKSVKKLFVKEDVYDISVKQNHNFVANGMVIHNCSEFVNIPYSSCNLGSINLTKFVRYNSFDWNAFENVIDISVNFLNNVIDVNIFPLKKIESITYDIRPIGLGVMGLGQTLYKLGIKYGSIESVEFVKSLSLFMTLKSMQTSVKLAKKCGHYKKFDYDLFMNANKRLFINNEFLFKNTSFEKNDYNKLLSDIKEYGTRNSCFTSIAPTGSISFLADTSSGIEPCFALSFIRKIEKLNHQYDYVSIIDSVFDDFLNKNYSKNKDKIIEYINNNGGSCQNCDLLSSDEKELFVTSKDLSPMQHLEVLEAMAKYCSLSVSKTINLNLNATENDVEDVYLKAYKMGIIGVTVYREGSREGILLGKKDTSGNKIIKTIPPKRPVKLPGEIHHFNIHKQKYYVAVGLYENEPYEIFVGLNYNEEGEVYMNKNVKVGLIEKKKRGKYIFYNNEDNNDYILTNGHSDDSADALTRMISTSLRHGVDINFVVHQLEKVKGSLDCFSKSLARALKKYIKDGTRVAGERCNNCNKENTIIRESGCRRCAIELGGCGASICG